MRVIVVSLLVTLALLSGGAHTGLADDGETGRLVPPSLARVSRSGSSSLVTRHSSLASRPRVIVSTDVGGTDPDDFQSMVHFLLYADVLDIEGQWSDDGFVPAHAAGRGALGDFFATLLDGRIKMGDSPSVGYLLRNTRDDPSKPGWGGRFVRIWDGRKTIFNRLTTEADSAEVFGVVELALPVPEGMTRKHSAEMIFDGRIPAVAEHDGSSLRFRFSPRDAKVWPYVIRSSFPALDGQSGRFRAVPPPIERMSRPSTRHPNWWIDDPDPAAAEDGHPGAKSVSRWREHFLRDFAARLRRTVPRSRL